MGPILHALYPREPLTEEQAWGKSIRLLAMLYPHTLADEWHSLTVYLDWQEYF